MPKECLEFNLSQNFNQKGVSFSSVHQKPHLCEENMWESDQDASTILGVLFATTGTTVCHSLKHFNGIIDLGK
jgi:hypothetical protein